MADAGPQLKPPDGGWGWMVVFAYGLANIMIVPVLQSFGLIFKDTFKEINISATKASVIINLASAVGMALGLFNGPLLRKYGFRKLAFAGGCLFSLGLMLTSSAEYFAHFIVTYSIIASLGMGFCNSSFSLALNTYFSVRRNKAAGIAMTITGLGPILLPQLVSLLLGLYGSRYCLLIIGALATHIVAGALLLQPVKWHMVPVIQPNPMPPTVVEKDTNVALIPTDLRIVVDDEADDDESFFERKSFIDHDMDAQSIYGFELTSQLRRQDSTTQTLPRAKSEVLNPIQRRVSLTDSLPLMESTVRSTEPAPRRWFQSGSIESVNLGSSIGIFEERRSSSSGSVEPSLKRRLSSIVSDRLSPRIKRWFDRSSETVNLGSSLKIFDDRYPSTRRSSHSGSLQLPMVSQTKLPALSENQGLTDDTRLPSLIREMENVRSVPVKGPARLPAEHPTSSPTTETSNGCFQKLVALFDLTLLRDKIYLNIMLGMSIAVFAEINFSLLTPFILSDLGYTTEEIASIMSTLALADLSFRFVSPFVGDMLKLTPRVMYMIALSMLIVTRFSILMAQTYQQMIVVAFGLGVAKGVRSVYMSLVIPSYIPLKRLPSASSIQMTTNGILLMTIGPCVGLIRDWSGSYSKSILFINAFTIVTLLMWATEMLYMQHCNQRKQDKVAVVTMPLHT